MPLVFEATPGSIGIGYILSVVILILVVLLAFLKLIDLPVALLISAVCALKL